MFVPIFLGIILMNIFLKILKKVLCGVFGQRSETGAICWSRAIVFWHNKSRHNSQCSGVMLTFGGNLCSDLPGKLTIYLIQSILTSFIFTWMYNKVVFVDLNMPLPFSN